MDSWPGWLPSLVREEEVIKFDGVMGLRDRWAGWGELGKVREWVLKVMT